jgi:hypothetical protein
MIISRGRWARYLMFSRLALALALVTLVPLSVGAAGSANYTANLTVTGGALDVSVATASYTAAAVPFSVLGGSASYTPTFLISDLRGLLVGGGWHLTITSITFNTGGGTSVYFTPTGSVSQIQALSAGAAVCQVLVPASCVAAVNTVLTATTLPDDHPAAPTANTFFSTPNLTGSGTLSLTPTVSITVPANTPSGSYSSTVTVAIVAGP